LHAVKAVSSAYFPVGQVVQPSDSVVWPAVSPYVPTAHTVQAYSAAVAPDHFPAGQAVHCAASPPLPAVAFSANFPLAQLLQALSPASSANRPDAHVLQAARPVTSANFPVAQSVHPVPSEFFPAPVPCLPVAHSTQTLASPYEDAVDAEYFPLGQREHTGGNTLPAVPLSANWPFGQVLQAPSPATSANCPALQAAHPAPSESFPVPKPYFPAAHVVQARALVYVEAFPEDHVPLGQEEQVPVSAELPTVTLSANFPLSHVWHVADPVTCAK
jgi:hypothetical protein